MTEPTEEERIVEFLIGLTELTRKTGIVIGGCGCCGSPSLSSLSPEESDKRAGYGCFGSKTDVTWINPSDDFIWRRNADKIVRRAV